MTVSVILGGHLRNEAKKGPQRRDVELPQGSKVEDLIREVGLSPERIKMIMVNGRGAELDANLGDGDRVGLFPPELAYNTFVAVSFRRKTDQTA
jgi:sulfur carrier protein ThiS